MKALLVMLLAAGSGGAEKPPVLSGSGELEKAQRFAVSASLQPQRFAIKAKLGNQKVGALCGPVPDDVFRNGFEN